MANIYDWIYFHKEQVLAGCALIISLLLVLILLIWTNASTQEALKEYDTEVVSPKRPPPWARVIYY